MRVVENVAAWIVTILVWLIAIPAEAYAKHKLIDHDADDKSQNAKDECEKHGCCHCCEGTGLLG